MVTAFQRFQQMQGERWESTLQAHLDHGYVYSDPLRFVMARPVSLSWSLAEIGDPTDDALSETSLTATRDCWYVWAAVGDMWYLLSLLPYHLEWIAFARRGRPKLHKHRLSDLLNHHGLARTTETCQSRSASPSDRG